MRGLLLRCAWGALLLAATAGAGINWKAVWLEPGMPVILSVGETQPYTVMGLHGGDGKADLTRSPYLVMASSDSEVLGVDREKAAFIGRKAGHVQIRIRFSEANTIVEGFVKEPKAAGGASR